MQNLNVVILAAGLGKRMYSNLPKVLHKIGDQPMLQRVIGTAQKLKPSNVIIVYGNGGDQVKSTIDTIFLPNKFIWTRQEQQLGTGHALKCALPHLDIEGATLLLYGDVPLIDTDTLQKMLSKYNNNVIMLTAVVDNPSGYGRVIRDADSQIVEIIEEKDASAGEKFINEVNTGFYLFPNKYLTKWLNNLSNTNSQGEYYVTDLIAMARKDAVEIDYVEAKHLYAAFGVNTKGHLEHLEREFQLSCADELLERGATLMDKSRIDIRGIVTVGKDCVIDVNCIFEGVVVLGDNVYVGAGSILKNMTIGNNVEIKPYSVMEDACIGDYVHIGPFARLRPGTNISAKAHIGNFVEIKNSTIGIGSKVNHLTYIGDATIGDNVNVGAGSVTCNYDGKNKSRTVIEDNVFVGSGTMMVAPVTLGAGSLIGAGSTITRDTPPNELTISRAKQSTIVGWLKKVRK